MSPKVNDGLSWIVLEKDAERFLLKRPLPIGGWYIMKDLSTFYRELNGSSGWGWEPEYHDEQNEGAALVAPLSILFWEKE